MKKSNTTLALIVAIAASASMTYAVTDNNVQKEWLPGCMMSERLIYKNGNVSKGQPTCTIYTYDDKGRYVDIETKNYNKDKDSFDNGDLTSYEYDEITGRVSLLVMKSYDSEVGDYVDRVKTIYTYTKDSDLPAVTEEFKKEDNDADWVQTYKNIRTYEYDPVCGKLCKLVVAYDTNINTEIITYDVEGVPQEYTCTNIQNYVDGHNVTTKSVYRNFEWTDGYNVDFSKSHIWEYLSSALEASCKYEFQEQRTSEYESTTTTTAENGMVEYIRNVVDGKLSYTKIMDARADVGEYRVSQLKETDEWGGYEYSYVLYDGLSTDEVPSQAMLKYQSKSVVSYTSPNDYTIQEWVSGDTPTEMYINYEETMATKVNPTFGYAESDVTTVARYKADGSQKSKQVTTNRYSDYKELIPNAITRIASDALHPRRVYTTDGVYVGSSTDNLPSGVYIVREGGCSMKVKK